jgi:hypothetical protein
MATKNPRISVMISSQSNDILTRLCAVTKQSKSSLIGQFLEESCMPMFERMAVVLEAAANATDEAKIALVEGMLQAEQKLHSVVGLTSDLFDQAALPVMPSERLTAAPPPPAAAARTEAAQPAASTRPPHVTRGSGTPNTATKADKSLMKTGSSLGSIKESTPKRVKRPSKALNTKVRG